MLIDIIAGARPNFIKIAPIIAEIETMQGVYPQLYYRLIHTGQHYDKKMSGDFFEQLGIPEPQHNLAVGSGTQAEQVAKIMVGYEQILLEKPCDLCIVVGDVNSTMACSIAAKKLNIKVAHVEAGIRSWDITMPEEINRMVTDSITDYFFTTSTIANENLTKLGIPKERVFFVGNTMIDTLKKQQKNFKKPVFFDTYNLQKGKYFVVTLHRPSNVDDETNLHKIIQTIVDNAAGFPLLFPVHPRTRKILEKRDTSIYAHLYLLEPLSYLEFNYLVENSLAVITDSGGITEETTVMHIPCMTLRDSTERPETCTIGTNELLGTQPDALAPAIKKLLTGQWKKGTIPEFWDGKTSQRIVNHIITLFNV